MQATRCDLDILGRYQKVKISSPINFHIFPIAITLILKTRLRRVETLTQVRVKSDLNMERNRLYIYNISADSVVVQIFILDFVPRNDALIDSLTFSLI